MGNLNHCKWCGRVYDNGVFYRMCSQKCQHEYYRAYPGEWEKDVETDKRVRKGEKQILLWIIIIVVLLYWYHSENY
jgi:predicted nucleic acid-binding Zn ribbon protein